MKGISEPPWWIPDFFVGEEAELNGVVLCSGPKAKPNLVGDFRNTVTSRQEQAANCRLAQRAPAMARGWLALEDQIGDLPAGPVTQKVYGIVLEQLRALGIERPEGEGDE